MSNTTFTQLFAKVWAKHVKGPHITFQDYRHISRAFVVELACKDEYKSLHAFKNTSFSDEDEMDRLDDVYSSEYVKHLEKMASIALRESLDTQAGHSTSTADKIYGVSSTSVPHMQLSVYSSFYLASTAWHKILLKFGQNFGYLKLAQGQITAEAFKLHDTQTSISAAS
ncbi:hypothetical protein GGF40_004251, partial [Coemansia sp. RSA 1286]